MYNSQWRRRWYHQLVTRLFVSVRSDRRCLIPLRHCTWIVEVLPPNLHVGEQDGEGKTYRRKHQKGNGGGAVEDLLSSYRWNAWPLVHNDYSTTCLAATSFVATLAWTTEKPNASGKRERGSTTIEMSACGGSNGCRVGVELMDLILFCKFKLNLAWWTREIESKSNPNSLRVKSNRVQIEIKCGLVQNFK